jgi:hypothetical protein
MRENDGSIYLTRRVGKVTKTQNLADSKIFLPLSDGKCAWRPAFTLGVKAGPKNLGGQL